MKITNPYSKKRFTLVEKFDRKITKILSPIFKYYIKKYGVYGMDIDKKPKYILSSFHHVAYFMKREEEYLLFKERNGQALEPLISMPSYIDLNLNVIFVSDLIQIENLTEFKKGLKKIFKEYNKSNSIFNRYDPENIDKFCEDVYKSLSGGEWSPIGKIEIDDEKSISLFVESIDVQVTHISSSFIVLGLTIYPSKSFLKEFKEIMIKHYQPEKIIKIRKEKFATQWKYVTLNRTSVKEKILEDYKLEIKWRVLKLFNKYIKLYLTNKKMIMPSIESFIITRDRCELNNLSRERYDEKLFFKSIMFNDHLIKDISDDGFTEIYNPFYSSGQDFSLKIVNNDRMPIDSMYNNIEQQITDNIDNFSKMLLPIMVINIYTDNLSNRFAKERKYLYTSFSKFKRYKTLLKIRSELEKEIQFLKRINNEFTEETIDRVASVITEEIGEFVVIDNPKHPTSIEMITKHAKVQLNKVTMYSQEITNLLDDLIKILEIKNNHSIRTWSLIISTIALVAAINNNWVSDLINLIKKLIRLAIKVIS